MKETLKQLHREIDYLLKECALKNTELRLQKETLSLYETFFARRFPNEDVSLAAARMVESAAMVLANFIEKGGNKNG